jgi:hypothetical protein
MPSPLIDTSEALKAAIKVSLNVRHERLMRAARNQKILTGVVFGLAACTALFSLAAFVAGDREAATIIALSACLTFCFACVAGKAGGKKSGEIIARNGSLNVDTFARAAPEFLPVLLAAVLR